MKKQKQKKILTIFIILFLLISASAVLNATGAIITNPTTISFEDKNLYDAIKNKFSSSQIAYNENDVTQEIEVSLNDIEGITELNLEGTEDAKIVNLSGMEKFINLTNLNLSGNAITNMTSITALSKLVKLDLTENTVNENILTSISQITTLTELNMTSTQMNGDQLEYFKTLQNLQTLIISNNNISKLEPIAILEGITKLDISKNASFVSFSQVTPHKNLKELNISGTGITTLEGIEQLTELEKLYAADNASLTTSTSISYLFKTYKVGNIDTIYLSKLKILNLSNLGTTGSRPSFNFGNFAKLTSLQELHLASNQISSLNNVANLENLDYLDLANNNIDTSDLENIVRYETVDGEEYVVTENVLKASKIDLRKNNIIKIDVFAVYPGDLKYLDLSENHIYDISGLSKHSFSEALYLQKQDITFAIYDKKVEGVDQYIILPNILKESQKEGSLVYTEKQLIFTGVTLNPDYPNIDEYNVIIDSEKTNDDVLNIKITGGRASGTVLNLQIGSTSGAHISCLIESLLFVDENLDAAIYSELVNKYLSKIKYLERVPKIININQDVISQIGSFNLQHTDASESTKIVDLTGLENFYNLTTLYLQDNNIKTIEPLRGCTKLSTLLLANNPNIGDNNEAILKMPALKNLDLSNTGMTNIDNINKLTESLKKPVLTILNLSDNGLENVDGLEKITSLQKLYIANEQLEDEDIEILAPLINLTTLNISGNNIENINVLSNLTNLQYLYFNMNKIQSLEPIDGMIFEELEFSGNRVKDITPLSAHHTINTLNMNNNKIEDVTILDDILITEDQKLSATGQKLVRVINENATGVIQIELPQIFQAAKDTSNKLYTESAFILKECTLDSTGKFAVINVDELGNKVAQVTIYGGKANGTVLTIAPPLTATVSYNPSNEEKTNQDITATITFNRNNVTILNNEGKNTYTFTENGEFTFEFLDEYGFEGSKTITIDNIDKTAPTISKVTQEIVNKTIKVTIAVNEPIVAPNGWTLAENKLSISKIYEEDANEEVKVADEVGNYITEKVNVKIDKTAPVITGVKDGEKYSKSVTPVIEDENFETLEITLTKNGTPISNYKSGDTIKEDGEYVLTAIDIFGNITTVSFEIKISDIITSEEHTVTESELTIKNIKPNTTSEKLKEKLNADMKYEIINKSGDVILDTAKVGTGYKIKMENEKVYTIIINGDTTSDGKADIRDILAINKHRLNKASLNEEYLEAADVNGDGKADIRDILQINKFRLGKISEL